jgi:hypothetical protein
MEEKSGFLSNGLLISVNLFKLVDIFHENANMSHPN